MKPRQTWMARALAWGCGVAVLLGYSHSVHALELYADNVLTNGGNNLGATELFYFGPIGAPGAWGIGTVTADGNSMGLLTADDNTGNGGHGASIHLPYPEAFAAHGPLEPGNVLRLSGWLAIDPRRPMNSQHWQLALLKVEFYSEPLGSHQNPDHLLFDSDQDSNGRLTTSFRGKLSSSEWRQFSLEHTIDPQLVDLARLKEVRPAIFIGDFANGEFTGNVLIDSLRVEVFPGKEAAAAHPLDTTYPGALPTATNPSPQ